MDLEDSQERLFRFEDPRKEDVYRRILSIGRGPADFFRDACELMARPRRLRTTTHLVAHCLREIESALRKVLEPVSERSARLASEARGSHRQEIIAMLKTLGIPETDPVATAWLRLADKEYGLARRAHRANLAPPRPADDEFEALWREMVQILDVILDRLENISTKYFAELDKLLAKQSPTRADAEYLRQRMPNNDVTLGYFFGKVKNPMWLPLLRDSDYFKHPPEPDVHPEKGVAFPRWAESAYLARMATISEVQDTVLEIVLAIPPTENPVVHMDLTEVALALPPERAACLSEIAMGWVNSRHQQFRPGKLVELVTHLAKGGQTNAALELAGLIFSLRSAPEKGSHRDDPQPRIRGLDFDELARRCASQLSESVGVRAFDLFAALLDDGIQLLGQRYGTDGREQEDLSRIWRPAIEDHSQNQGRRAVDCLVSAVRDAADVIASGDANQVPDMVARLEARKRPVFRRLALHLLRRFHEAAPDLVSARLTDYQLFRDHRVHHEYVMLLQNCYGRLSDPDKEMILCFIEKGPDPDGSQERFVKQESKSPSEEENKRYLRAWQRDRLVFIADTLPPNWQKRYRAMVTELGQPDHPEFRSYMSTVSWGSSSPISADDLTTMSVEEIISYLAQWQPSGESMEPSTVGMGRTLSQCVKASPDRFAQEAVRFKETDPTYVRSFFQGLRDAISGEHALTWDAILDLAAWVIQQETVATSKEHASGRSDGDPDWGWTRGAIADLLSDGLRPGPSEIPIEHQSRVWELVADLSEDPDPTPDRDASEGMDPATRSINTVRGQAMHAVVDYGLWLRRRVEKQGDFKELLDHGFDEMPEVREVLDRHLDPAHDPSVSIRSVYGQRFPLLIHLDQSWADLARSQVFPHEAELDQLWRAAWLGYVLFCQPYTNVAPLLLEEYRHAIEKIGSWSEDHGFMGDCDRHLSEHLMVMYWWGNLDLNDEEGLLRLFFRTAGSELRFHAIDLIGRCLRDTKNGLTEEILGRLQSLWVWRLEEAHASSHRPDLECAAFGSWFTSGKLEEEWALEQLEAALEVAGNAEPDHMVMDKLAELTVLNPLRAVRCLHLFANGDREGWRLMTARDDAMTILRTALGSEEENAKREARELINRLVGRGYLDYKDLLPEREDEEDGK